MVLGRGRSDMAKVAPPAQEVREVLLECRSDKVEVSDPKSSFFHLYVFESKCITKLQIYLEGKDTDVELVISIQGASAKHIHDISLKPGKNIVVGKEGLFPVEITPEDRISVKANKPCTLWYSVVIR